jgi:hypothetical protein
MPFFTYLPFFVFCACIQCCEKMARQITRKEGRKANVRNLDLDIRRKIMRSVGKERLVWTGKVDLSRELERFVRMRDGDGKDGGQMEE